MLCFFVLEEYDMQKYNIALVPAHHPQKFINYAQSLAKTTTPDQYLIGEHSLPHVSLCHFLSPEDHIEEIWNAVQALNAPPLSLRFTQHESKVFLGSPKYQDIIWVSLMPDQRQELKKWHLAAAEIIKEPLNAAYDRYDPHLTLFNSRDKPGCLAFNIRPQVYPVLVDTFVMALGITDRVGQVTKLLFSVSEL